MPSSRHRKHTLYARLARLPLDLFAASDGMAQSSRRLEKQIGVPPCSHSLYYILKGRRPVPAPFWKYMAWMRAKSPGRHRATLTIARSHAGAYTVSTVFLGLDHGFPPGSAPVLFETMAYQRRADGKNIFRDEQYRYRTYAEAIRGHRQFAARLSTLRAVA